MKALCDGYCNSRNREDDRLEPKPARVMFEPADMTNAFICRVARRKKVNSSDREPHRVSTSPYNKKQKARGMPGQIAISKYF